MSATLSPAKWLLGVVVLLLGLIPAANPAQAKTSVTNFVYHPQQVTGDFRSYGYSSASNTTWDADADWASGTYASTKTVPASGAVTLVGTNGVDVWWNSAWQARRCFVVTNPASYALAAHPVALSYDSTVDLANGALAAGATDLRATTGGGSPTALPFDVAGPWPAANSVVWVKVPPLAAGGASTVCLYFKNPTAVALAANPSARVDPLYRVRSAASTITDPAGNWVPDAPSPAGVTVNTGNLLSTSLVLPLDSSVPVGTPSALFSSERWDAAGGPELRYRFAVPAGRPVRVRILESEIYFAAAGQRIFTMNLEGGPAELTNFDPAATCIARGRPARCGLAFDYPVASSVNGFIDVDFVHQTENPKVAAIEVLDETVLGFTGGVRENYAAVVGTGTWTSAVVDTGAAGVYGLITPTQNTPTGTNITYQIASSASPSGPWAYLGPDGTAATNYAGIGPIHYSADANRYFRVRATLTGSPTATPSLTQLRIGHSLTLLSRVSGGRASVTLAAGTGLHWAIRMRSTEPTLTGASGTLVVDPSSTWGGASLSSAFATSGLLCCGPTQFSVSAGVLSASPTAVTVPPSAGLSIAVTRVNATAATADVTFRARLAGAALLELPLRMTAP